MDPTDPYSGIGPYSSSIGVWVGASCQLYWDGTFYVATCSIHASALCN